jgi:hypothetical protein
MFRTRRHLAAAAGFWVVLLAAAFGISVVPGATAADTPASSGVTLQQQVTHAGPATRATNTKRRKRPRRRGYVKKLDSTNATPPGLGGASNHCTLSRSGLGDTFTMEEASDRCTWVNTHFSHMHRHEIFELSVRFDSRHEATDWENVFTFRPTGFPPVFRNANCPGDGPDGNAYVMLLNLYVNSTPSPDRWQLDIRGGKSINLSDQVVKRLKLGPVVVGRTLHLKFDIVTDYRHGAASVWKNGVLVYKNRDRPLGFHYDCDRTTGLSDFRLQMQHGVYRGGDGVVTLSSSGFRFLVSKRVRSRDS